MKPLKETISRLKAKLKENNICIDQLASACKKTINWAYKLLSGQVPVSMDLSHKLANLFGDEKSYWYDLALDEKYKLNKEVYVLLDDGTLSPYIAANGQEYSTDHGGTSPNELRIELIRLFTDPDLDPADWRDSSSYTTDQLTTALRYCEEYLLYGEYTKYVHQNKYALNFLEHVVTQIPKQEFRVIDIEVSRKVLDYIGLAPFKEGKIKTNYMSLARQKKVDER